MPLQENTFLHQNQGRCIMNHDIIEDNSVAGQFLVAKLTIWIWKTFCSLTLMKNINQMKLFAMHYEDKKNFDFLMGFWKLEYGKQLEITFPENTTLC